MTNIFGSNSRIQDTLLALPLIDSDLHIWCVSLNVSPRDLSRYSSLLSKDEVERAGRFYFEKDRDHFIVGRGLLRTILGAYLEVEPSQIEFEYGQFGKPALKTGSYKIPLAFNLSHSKDVGLYAVGLNHRIGVDLEYVHPMPNMDDFVEQLFSPNESEWVNSLSGEQKDEAFFKVWTCKEAFLKANGNGLTIPINQVETCLEADGSIMLIPIKEQAGNWRLDVFSPVAGYQAALASEGHGGHINLRQLYGRFDQ